MSCRNQTLSIPAEPGVHPSALGLGTLISSSQTVPFLFISVTFAYSFYLLRLLFVLLVLKSHRRVLFTCDSKSLKNVINNIVTVIDIFCFSHF